ncbi:uncharacterized protein LOC131427686 [Malaya genurostris]|uniref:uncharacterized protein LOC131427686 n=1 Tax=Malaya genurostris TaxID=325434 RepID=UPI0026F40260|nr:uncharacterized protein LOC131427686 [Malaya genurostris]
MFRKVVTSKIDSGITQKSKTRSNILQPSERPKSASLCDKQRSTRTPQQRPWSSSVLLEKKSNTALQPIHVLGHRPAYLKKTKSVPVNNDNGTMANDAERLPSIKGENPPKSIPNELGRPANIDRQTTFVRQENFPPDDESPMSMAMNKQNFSCQVPDRKNIEPNSTDHKDAIHEIHNLKAEISRLNRMIAGDQNALQQRDKRIKELENSMYDVRVELIRLGAEKDNLEQQVQVLNERLEATSGLEELEDKICRMALEMERLKSENETFRKHQCHLEYGFSEVEEDSTIPDELPGCALEEDRGRNPMMVERLNRKLDKYRVSRSKLRYVLGQLMVENQRMRSIIENRPPIIDNPYEGEHHLISNEFDGIIINRFIFHEQLRSHKRSKQSSIAVKKYEA